MCDTGRFSLSNTLSWNKVSCYRVTLEVHLSPRTRQGRAGLWWVWQVGAWVRGCRAAAAAMTDTQCLVRLESIWTGLQRTLTWSLLKIWSTKMYRLSRLFRLYKSGELNQNFYLRYFVYHFLKSCVIPHYFQPKYVSIMTRYGLKMKTCSIFLVELKLTLTSLSWLKINVP